jgi:hypothetical protein
MAAAALPSTSTLKTDVVLALVGLPLAGFGAGAGLLYVGAAGALLAGWYGVTAYLNAQQLATALATDAAIKNLFSLGGS